MRPCRYLPDADASRLTAADLRAEARGTVLVRTRASRRPSGYRFESTIESLTQVGDYDAVVPSVAGQAWITDISQVGLDPTDPFPLGYTLSDSWMRADTPS